MKLTSYKDYLEKVYEEFAEVDRLSIRDIVKHGLSMLVLFKKNDHDIYLSNERSGLFYYIGDVSKSYLHRVEITLKKRRRKMRLVSRLSKESFDGVYSFGLREEQLQQLKEKGSIDKVHLYRLKREIYLDTKCVSFYNIKMDSQEYLLTMLDFKMDTATPI